MQTIPNTQAILNSTWWNARLTWVVDRIADLREALPEMQKVTEELASPVGAHGFKAMMTSFKSYGSKAPYWTARFTRARIKKVRTTFEKAMIGATEYYLAAEGQKRDDEVPGWEALKLVVDNGCMLEPASSALER